MSRSECPHRSGRGPRRAASLRLLLACALLLATSVLADERILSYHVDLSVQPDASVLVTEDIRVRTEGRQIRRGIFRDFPTRYRDRRGNRYRVDFDLLAVERDGEPEPYHTESRNNGIRIYAGSSSRMLPPGTYTYRLRYRTTRQLVFRDTFDELYWNVTGNGWAFPIDRASARVVLPAPVPAQDLTLDLYTGSFGAVGKDASARVVRPGEVFFETTAPLGAREGLTVSVTWPKGVVAEPTGGQRAAWFLRDNAGALVLLVGFAAMLGWYLWAWNRKGRDPKKGVIIPRYEPPKGLSPAACRYVLDMGFGRNAFTAAVVSLGVKGWLEIREEDDDFTLYARDGEAAGPAPSPGEKAVFDALFPSGRGSIELKQEHHARFRAARSGIERALKREYQGRFFNLNGWYALPAILVSLLASAAAAVVQLGNPLIWVAWGLLALGAHALFIFLLRAPTPGGRRIMDEIEGFRLYLDTAEQDRLDRMRSPELTPEVFEAFLPYAFALGVENRWVARFQHEFPEADPDRGGYQPAWYRGDLSGARSLGHIGSELGSNLSGAISSAATPPGSSSGSGGGGSSGGGGGGGGGGGW